MTDAKILFTHPHMHAHTHTHTHQPDCDFNFLINVSNDVLLKLFAEGFLKQEIVSETNFHSIVSLLSFAKSQSHTLIFFLLPIPHWNLSFLFLISFFSFFLLFIHLVEEREYVRKRDISIEKLISIPLNLIQCGGNLSDASDKISSNQNLSRNS